VGEKLWQKLGRLIALSPLSTSIVSSFLQYKLLKIVNNQGHRFPLLTFLKKYIFVDKKKNKDRDLLNYSSCLIFLHLLISKQAQPRF
jgi:hypothetical protein